MGVRLGSAVRVRVRARARSRGRSRGRGRARARARHLARAAHRYDVPGEEGEDVPG